MPSLCVSDYSVQSRTFHTSGNRQEEIEEVEKNPDYEICTTCQGDGQVDEDTAKECAGYFDSEFN